MFVPDQWGHSFVSQEESIGYAQEFTFGQREL
jgi:hypothetical protein